MKVFYRYLLYGRPVFNITWWLFAGLPNMTIEREARVTQGMIEFLYKVQQRFALRGKLTH